MAKAKKNNIIIKISGVFILIIFSLVIIKNIKYPEREIINFYKPTTPEILKLEILNNKLEITTKGDAQFVCAKTTKSTPETNSLCWKDVNNNKTSVSVYHNKKYYVWIKDSDNTVFGPKSINVN